MRQCAPREYGDPGVPACCPQERLGLLLDKEDEMDCLVGGANFLLRAIRHEAFMYENGQTVFALSNCERSPAVSPLWHALHI